jgi:hypothetical protein
MFRNEGLSFQSPTMSFDTHFLSFLLQQNTSQAGLYQCGAVLSVSKKEPVGKGQV